ncbi:MAG TPA: C40 family peptidase, partial [Mycobacteriales bacterium]
ALSKLGSPYVWAAAGPDSFDCSGLMLWAWAQAGVALPHYTGDQYNMGTHVGIGELQPGDLVFFYEGLSHVGMYIGGGNVVHAPQPGDVVKIASVDSFPFAGATRVG